MVGTGRGIKLIPKLTRRADGCVTTVAWVAVAVIVLAAGLSLWLRHTTAESAPPDPAAFARSLATRHADEIDTTWDSAQFTRLAQLVPQLTGGGRAVFDACSVEGSPSGLFGGGTGYEFTCSRTDTRYYAFGGPSAAGIRRAERALRQLGWGGFIAGPRTGSPAGLPVMNADPLTPVAAPPAGKTGLKLSWAEHATRLNLEHNVGTVPTIIAPRRNTYIAVQRPSLKEILASLTAARPHLLIVSMTATYAQRLQPP